MAVTAQENAAATAFSWSSSSRLEYAFGCELCCSHECSGPGIPAGCLRRAGPRVAGRLGAADAAGPRCRGGPAAGVAERVGGGVRAAVRGGRPGPVAGREAAYVRQGGGGPPAALLLRRGRAVARSGADRRAAGAERALRPGTRRAVPHRGPVPVPGRAGQRGLARRHDRARQMRGHHGGHLVAGYAAAADAAAARRGDLAQAAFARAYAFWPKVRRTGNPEAYVRRIVINENRNRFRRPRVAERLTDAPESARADTASADTTRQYDERSALMAALQRLGPRQRAVVVLRYWLGLTEAEAAAELNCSVGPVQRQASRALAALRQSAELVDGGFQ